MSERTNQTAEIALRYYITTLDNQRQWPTIIDKMSASLNNSTKYSSTNLSPTQVLYGFKTREALDLLRVDDNRPPAEGFSNKALIGEEVVAIPVHPPIDIREYRPAHIDASDAIAFTAMKMKDYYDSHHTPIFFKVGEIVNLRLHRGYRIPAIKSKKIGQQFAGPFRVTKRIGQLAYELDLPSTMKIHNVISVAHLEPATIPADDPYLRRRPAVPAVVDNHEE